MRFRVGGVGGDGVVVVLMGWIEWCGAGAYGMDTVVVVVVVIMEVVVVEGEE